MECPTEVQPACLNVHRYPLSAGGIKEDKDNAATTGAAGLVTLHHRSRRGRAGRGGAVTGGDGWGAVDTQSKLTSNMK